MFIYITHEDYNFLHTLPTLLTYHTHNRVSKAKASNNTLKCPMCLWHRHCVYISFIFTKRKRNIALFSQCDSDKYNNAVNNRSDMLDERLSPHTALLLTLSI